MFAAGLADDLYGLPPLAKLAAQGAAAAIVLATGTHVQLVHNQLIGDAIAVLWLIGVANAFNLLDNMDGLAATLAAIAFGFFAIDAVTVHPDDASLAFALAGGARLRRLPALQPRGAAPALVFMGDSGSQMLGFALAALGLTSSWRVAGTTVATLLLPVLVLAVPILDTTLVTVARLLDGRPIYQGGRDHSSHRLVRFGLSERHAVALLALISLCIGGSSLAYNVARQRPLHDHRRRPDLRRCSSSSRASSPTSTAGRSQLGEPLGLAEVVRGALAAARRGARRLLPDHRPRSSPPTRSEFGWPGTDTQRFIRDLTLPVVLAARYLAFIPFGLYRSVWRYAGVRDALAAAAAVLVSEFVALTLHGLHPGHARLQPLVLHHRRADLHGRDRRLAVRRADARDRDALGARPHGPADADRRRRPHRAAA